jgi:hypothetical protein
MADRLGDWLASLIGTRTNVSRRQTPLRAEVNIIDQQGRVVAVIYPDFQFMPGDKVTLEFSAELA